jgi:uncharacterized Fe-S cluster-containing radical SAM superfamily protein
MALANLFKDGVNGFPTVLKNFSSREEIKKLKEHLKEKGGVPRRQSGVLY